MVEKVISEVKAASPDLSVSMAGVRFTSPIGVGAVGRPWGRELFGDPEAHANVLIRHVKAGAGYVYIPNCGYISEASIKKARERARPEILPDKLEHMGRSLLKFDTNAMPYGREGLFTISAPFLLPPEIMNMRSAYGEKLMRLLRQRLPSDARVVAQVVGIGDITEGYVDSAKRWEELGADLIEINLSCPLPATVGGAVEDYFNKRFPARFQGSLIGDQEELVEDITRAVVKAVKTPVGVKLSPETGFPRIIGLARAIKNAGAKYICVVNGGIGIAPPDIYNRGKSPWHNTSSNPFCMFTGSWLRGICYRDVAAIARFVPGIEIAAAGGLVIPEHYIEVMMLGAKLVQPCTGVIEQGRSLIRNGIKFFSKFMSEQGYKSTDEFIGLAQPYIDDNEKIILAEGKSHLDESKCNKCGACVDNLCTAIYSDKGKIKIKEEVCNGCGGCVVTCPNEAFSISPA